MNLQQLANKLSSEYSHYSKSVDQEKQKLTEAKLHLEAAKSAQQIVQNVAQAVQQTAHDQIANVVTRCLQSVFQRPYEFKILFEKKRNKTEARLVFVRDEKEIDPTSASGGGVIDVASLALRLSCLMLSRPKLRKILILDEPFKFISRGEYKDRMRELLIKLSQELEVQIIMVTHDEEFEIGKVIEL